MGAIKDEDFIKSVDITREYLTPYSTVFEIGCGTGEMAIRHSPYVKSIHAIDACSENIQNAAEKSKKVEVTNIKFERKDIDGSFKDVRDNSFDAVGIRCSAFIPKYG